MYIVIGFDEGNLCLMTRTIFANYDDAKKYADSCAKGWKATVMKQAKE